MASLSPQTILFLGTGGVGKTTLASLYALKQAAKQKDHKIKLVTIDPSERLRDYFGLSQDKTETTLGNLTVAVSDRESLFRKFVLESLNNDEAAVEKVYQNKIFQRLVGGLAVSQEFTSLYELAQSGREGYDMVVVDTPPLQNAGAFLEAASSLKSLFSSSLIKFILPDEDQGVLFKIFGGARKKALEILSRLTGQSFVVELADFFTAIEKIRPKLLEVLEQAEVLLEQTQIKAVCNSNELSLSGLKLSLVELENKGLKVNGVYVNKFGQAPERSAVVEQKILEIQKQNKALSFQRIQKFDRDLASYEDLVEVKDHVEL